MAIAVLDWFLLEGGEPIYEQDPADDDSFDFTLYEVRMPEFEVFIGPPTAPGPWAVEVAACVRRSIPLEVDFVEKMIASFATQRSERHQVDVFATEDFGSSSTVWLATRLTRDEVESSDIDAALVDLLTEARAMHHFLAP